MLIVFLMYVFVHLGKSSSTLDRRIVAALRHIQVDRMGAGFNIIYRLLLLAWVWEDLAYDRLSYSGIALPTFASSPLHYIYEVLALQHATYFIGHPSIMRIYLRPYYFVIYVA